MRADCRAIYQNNELAPLLRGALRNVRKMDSIKAGTRYTLDAFDFLQRVPRHWRKRAFVWDGWADTCMRLSPPNRAVAFYCV